MATRDTWEGVISTMRGATGDFEARRPKGAGYLDKLDEFPEKGTFAIVEFESRFENATVMEKVALHEHDGRLRVVGYFMSKNHSVTLGGDE
jgi:hypothetical protein